MNETSSEIPELITVRYMAMVILEGFFRAVIITKYI
jgi:hypothetical protein